MSEEYISIDLVLISKIYASLSKLFFLITFKLKSSDSSFLIFLTKKLVNAMYEGMDFLRAEKIVNEIPKPQFVILRHSKNKKLSGTLLYVVDNTLYIQTATTIEKIELNKIDRFSYRPSLGNFDYLRPYTFFVTGLTGFAMASLYNAQRPVTYNEYGIPRLSLIHI